MSEERIKVGDRVTIVPRGRKRIYTAEFTHEGQHRRKSLRTSNVKVARQRAIQLEADLEAGRYRAAPASTGIGEALELYLAHLATAGRRPRTLATYRNALDAFRVYCESQRVPRLPQVTPRLFDGFREQRRKGRTARTLYNQSVIVKMFMVWCRSRRLIAENPFADYSVEKPRSERKPVPVLEQVRSILGACDAELRPRVATLAFTGLRSGELRNLHVEDVDLVDGWIDVVSRDASPTKTGASRRVPIHPELATILSKTGKGSGPWYFTAARSSGSPAGGNCLSTARLNDRFKRAAERVGLPTGSRAGFTIHSLRRFFKSHTINSGVPKPVVDRWIGHDPSNSMDNLYYELHDKDSRAWMDRVPFDEPRTPEIET